jgi:hypothetical protein
MDSRLKKTIFALVLAIACCLAALPAAAQDMATPDLTAATADSATSPASALAGGQDKPAPTTPETVALLFYKLTRQAPDLEAWVKEKDSYKNASAFDQPGMMKDMVDHYKEKYNLLVTSDPIIVETPVTLAPYDSKNGGFFVESFKSSTFYPVRFNGQAYAIVPQGILDKQWLKMDDTTVANTIEASAISSNHVLTMFLYLTPKFADNLSPAMIDDEKFWPISVEVRKMALYALNSDTLLWHSDTETRDKTYDGIVGLHQ